MFRIKFILKSEILFSKIEYWDILIQDQQGNKKEKHTKKIT